MRIMFGSIDDLVDAMALVEQKIKEHRKSKNPTKETEVTKKEEKVED